MACLTSLFPIRSRELIGSSRTRASGEPTRARAISTRRASPVDSVWKRRPARWAEPTAARLSMALRLIPRSTSCERLVPIEPKKPDSTASRQSMSLARSTCRSAETSPKAFRTSKRFQRSFPLSLTYAPGTDVSCLSSPIMVLIREDFPEPFGPRMTSLSPCRTVRSIPLRSVALPLVTVTFRISTIGSPGIRDRIFQGI